jgi:hypothetical protein
VLALALGPGAAAPAAAKDLCVEDSFNGAIVWKKVKSMKKVGSIVPLTGVLVSPPVAPGFVAPVAGTAVTRADGMILIGFTVLGQATSPTSQTGTASLIVDQTLAGSGFRDLDGDYVQGDAITWTPVDCDGVDFP